MSFKEMVKYMANRWKQLDPKSRGFYESKAAKDMERYKNEVEAHKKLVVELGEEVEPCIKRKKRKIENPLSNGSNPQKDTLSCPGANPSEKKKNLSKYGNDTNSSRILQCSTNSFPVSHDERKYSTLTCAYDAEKFAPITEWFGKGETISNIGTLHEIEEDLRMTLGN
eukprot:CAMPEP_0195534728 /NCGR_PEP_ID=MMETSP0794_2-20130614/42932_1 /TAXON_ID=515487 /ORGANISM="Stephanopyxis turris, Strain CCMP 815" /LENGTH=167 /DNA_ID=CAMNT_0040667667 /DNA_START=179 /DNA_END=679 /DNA_ORIENTATION=-